MRATVWVTVWVRVQVRFRVRVRVRVRVRGPVVYPPAIHQPCVSSLDLYSPPAHNH